MNYQRANMIATDLIKYYLGDSVKYKINNRLRRAYGRCIGRYINNVPVAEVIELNPVFIMNKSEEDVIYTILHEIAHALTMGQGHSLEWKRKFNELLENWAEANRFHKHDLIFNSVK